MTVVKRSREVSYSCPQMYALVNDIDHYADFLPYCVESVVHQRDEDEVQATLMISAAGMSKSFTTRNRLQPNKMIEIRMVNGPFSHLEGFWRFDEMKTGGCKLSFDLEFEFSGRMVAMILQPFFEEITEQVFDAFCARAEALYRDQHITAV